MKKCIIVIAGFCIVLLSISLLSAEEMKVGLHGMAWGSSVEQHTQLTKVRESAPVAFYINSTMSHSVSNQLIPKVVYGFYEDRFYAVYIRLNTPDQFLNLKRHFTSKYGAPKEEHDGRIRQSVYRWKDAVVKIKLKMTASTGEFKLAIYYTPLSARVNEEQEDDLPADVTESSPAEGAEKQIAAPLFEER